MALVTKTFSDIITFTRNSGATYFDSNGVLQTAGNNVPRLDYNPITLAAQGLLIEEARTNSIRNNTMVGAVAGTPGTLPTNWNISGLGTLNQQVVAVSTINGINYIDLRFSGTTSTTQLSIRSEPGGTGAIAAANGQTWSMSLWSAMVAGSLTNISGSGYGTLAYDGAGAFIGAPFSSGVLNTTSTLTRTERSGTIAIAGTAFIQPQIYLFFNSGVAIDITLRIGLPQLERGAFATSVIPTVNAFALGVTREADVASVNTLSPWFNATEGTLFAEWASFLPNGSQSAYSATFTDNPTLSTSVQLSIQSRALNNQIRVWQSTTGGGLDDFITLSVVTFQGKTAVAYGGGSNVSASANGGAVSTMVNPLQSSVFTNLLLGYAAGTTGQLDGWLRRVTYYPRRLSNAELVSITTP